jgi:hypothetical protein
MMQLHIADFITAANFLVLCGILRKLSIFTYQHKLMWQDFAARKGLLPKERGASAAD